MRFALDLSCTTAIAGTDRSQWCGKSNAAQGPSRPLSAHRWGIDRNGRTETLFDLSLLWTERLRQHSPADRQSRHRPEEGDALFARSPSSASSNLSRSAGPDLLRGMLARLGFSVATAIEAEILLVEKFLGAGDQYFLKKSVRRIEEMSERSAFSAGEPQLETLRQFCNQRHHHATRSNSRAGANRRTHRQIWI